MRSRRLLKRHGSLRSSPTNISPSRIPIWDLTLTCRQIFFSICRSDDRLSRQQSQHTPPVSRPGKIIRAPFQIGRDAASGNRAQFWQTLGRKKRRSAPPSCVSPIYNKGSFAPKISSTTIKVAGIRRAPPAMTCDHLLPSGSGLSARAQHSFFLYTKLCHKSGVSTSPSSDSSAFGRAEILAFPLLPQLRRAEASNIV